MPLPGDLVGRFRIERCLGAGGMGAVYLAHDTILDTEVALKFFAERFTNSERFERFKRELLVARRLSHPGICKLFDIHHEQQRLFLSMEYVAGRTLHEVIHQHRGLPVGVALKVLIAVARAVSVAHQSNVLHRDLKPANIIVRPDHTITLLDFGLSKAADMSTITAVGSPMGTFAYMAPELLGHAPASVQSDIYALGVALYEALTGRLPFQHTDFNELVREIAAGHTPPPSRHNHAVTPALDRVVARAMHMDAAQRYADMRAFAADLEELLLSLDDGSDSFVIDQPEEPPWLLALDEVVGTALATPSAQRLLQADHRELVVMFAEMVGFAPYVDKHGEAAGQQRIQKLTDLTFPIIEKHAGTVVMTHRNAFVACFTEGDRAVEAAVMLLRALRHHNGKRSDEDERMHLRMGLHAGSTPAGSAAALDDLLRTTASIAALASSEQILLSGGLFRRVRRFRGRVQRYGEHTLHGSQGTRTLFSLLWISLHESPAGLRGAGAVSVAGRLVGGIPRPRPVVAIVALVVTALITLSVWGYALWSEWDPNDKNAVALPGAASRALSRPAQPAALDTAPR